MGNSYVTWNLQDTYEINGHVFTSHGLSDFAVTSYACDGTYRWTKTIGGSSNDAVRAVQTDSLGGVYLISNANIGRLETDNLYIDDDTIIDPHRKGLLVVKYNTDGDFQWLRMPEDTVIIDPTNLQLAAVIDMDVAPNGDCYIYSKLPPETYADGAYEATFPLTPDPNSGRNLYALKYDRNGNCTGGIHLDMYYSSSVLVQTDFTRDHITGNFYASGFNRHETDTIALENNTIDRITGYLICFNNLGNLNWVKTANDSVVNEAVLTSAPLGKLAFSPSGNIYAGGGAGGSGAGFGDFTFVNSLGNYLTGFPVIFKFSPSGELVDATSASTNATSAINTIALADNIVGAAGTYGSKIIWGDLSALNVSGYYNVLLARFNSDSFNQPIALDTLQSSVLSTEYVSYLTSDNQGNFYIGGRFSSTLYIADDTLYNQTGTSEGFIAKFGSDSCYCPLPVALFSYDTIPDQGGYAFAYTGTAEVDSVVWDFGDGQSGYGINPSHLFAESGTYMVCATAYNSCGAASVCMNIDATGPDAVKVINGFEKIRLYPNPAQEWLNIANAEFGTRVDMISSVGVRLYSSELHASSSQMDISALPPGVYLLQLTDRSGRRGYARFVKE